MVMNWFHLIKWGSGFYRLIRVVYEDRLIVHSGSQSYVFYRFSIAFNKVLGYNISPLRFNSSVFLRCLALSKAGRSDSETLVQASSLFFDRVIHSPGVP